MPRLLAAVLFVLARAVAALPWRVLVRVANALAARALRTDSREARVTARNLELAYPELLASERTSLQRDVLATTARQTLATLRLWTQPAARNLTRIDEQFGVEHFDAALSAGRGVIVAAPHHGNWELLNQWLAARTPLAILYAPPESAVGDAFLQRVRAAQDDPGRVTQIRAEAAGARQLFKWLQGGGVVGILPDQQPKQGDGEFAPFFGRPALTMSLLGRLAARTGATVLVAWCESIGEDAGGPRFALHIAPAPADIASRDVATSVAALNHAVEQVARRDPSQYQWTYKRFSIPPNGGANPYWPDCY